MSLLDRISRREAQGQPVPAKTAGVAEEVTSAHGVNTSLTVPAFARGVNLIATTMSQMVMKYQKISADGSNFSDDMGGRYLPGTSVSYGQHMNWLVQKQPNPYMNWVTMVRLAEVRRQVYGNAYIYIERRGTDVESFWLCNFAQCVNHMWRISFFQEDKMVNLAGVSRRDIIHLKNTFTEDNGLTGIPTIVHLKRTLDTAATLDSLMLKVGAKGGTRKAVVQEEKQQGFGMGRVNQEQAKAATDQFRKEFATEDIIYLNNALGLHDFSYSPQELCIDALKKATVLDIARALGLPPILLMDNSSSNYKTPEAATLELYRTLGPLVREWEDEFDTKVLDPSDFGKHRFHLCEDNLFRLDREGQANWETKMLAAGVYSPNELRSIHELPRLDTPGADDHYMSTNLAVVGSKKLTGEEKGGTK